MTKISPSILTVDFGHLADEIISLSNSGADWLHLDVMDNV
jgi:ribulose-phosphate 3-epimerase